MAEQLFFAILPDRSTAAMIARRLAATCRQRNIRPTMITAERFHVSIHAVAAHPVAVPTEEIQHAVAAAAAIDFPAFRVTFDCALRFAGPRHPYVLASRDGGTDTLTVFRRIVVERFRRRASAYVPHLTLFYDAPAIPAHAIRPVSWIVREFVLIRSLIGRRRYEIAGRWPLSE